MEKLRHTPMVTLRECFMFPMKYLPLKNDKSINVLYRTSLDILSVTMLNKNLNKKTVEQNDTILAITRDILIGSLVKHVLTNVSYVFIRLNAALQ